MVYTRTKIALLASLLLPFPISAVPQNYTVDDSDQSINYLTAADWSHDPLAGYEQFFFEGTRSFTYVPGAAALFNFTGTGIYLQGPHSNDQAFRSVILDGQNMGVFAAYAQERLPTEGTSSVFWGQGGLTNTLHTVIVMHVDTADKILVMDAWIYESDPSQSPQGMGTNAVDSAAPSSSSTSGSDSDTAAGIIIGVSIPALLLPLCIAGYCLFSRRLERNAKRQQGAMKEKMYSSFRNPTPLGQPLYPTVSRSTPSHWLSANGTSAPEPSSSNFNTEFVPAGAVVPRRDGGGGIPSFPFHDRPRAASDAYNNEDSVGISNHPLFALAPLTSRFSDSSDSHYPTQPPYAGAPALFFEQRPDPIPPLNSDYAPQPIVNAPPTSPSVLRRLSAGIASVIPARPTRNPLRNSNAGKRRPSVLPHFRYATTSTTSPGVNDNLGLDVESAAEPPTREHEHDAYFPYTPPHLPSSPNHASIPLAATSAVSMGFGRQSANLEDLKYETSDWSRVDTPHTLNPGAMTPHRDGVKAGDLIVEREVKSKRGSKADPFDDENAFSSYTHLKRDGVLRCRPVSSIGASNSQ